MTIRTFFVDLGKVVVDFNQEKHFRAITDLTGRNPDEAHAPLTGPFIHQFETGMFTPREFFLKMLLELGVVVNEKDFWAAYCSDLEVFPEVVQILREARASGIEIIAASNVDPVRYEHVRVLGGLEPFHKSGLSFQFRSRKPEKDFYRKLAALTESRPQECLFIDDMEENVRAAAEFGFVVIQHTRADLLRRALQGFGVLP